MFRVARESSSLCRRMAASSAAVAAITLAGIPLMSFWNLGAVPRFLDKLACVASAAAAALLWILASTLGRRADAWVARLALFSASLIVAVLVAELALRLALRDVTTTSDGRSYFARRWTATHVRLNSLGYREREFPREKPAGVFRVAVIGDSFTFGQGVEEADRFSNRLEQTLQPLHVEFLNFGRGGAETEDELVTLKRSVLPTRPDFILLQWYVNDVEGQDKSSRPRPIPLWNHWSTSIVERHSVLYFVLNERWRGLQESMHLGTSYVEYMHSTFGDPQGPAMREYARILHEFIATCRSSDIPLAMVLFSNAREVVTHDFDYLHREILDLCHEEAVECFDLTPVFASAAGRGVDLQVSAMEGHPSAAANEIAAAAILDQLGARWRAHAPRG